MRDHMDDVNKQIAELGNVEPDNKTLLDYRHQLKELKKDLDDVNRTMKDYTRGVKAADELLKAAETGTIEKLSMKAIKSGANGLRKRIENIQPDTLSPEDQQAYRIIKQVIDEADNVVNKFKTDAAETIRILQQGGTVSEKTMRQARDGVKSLMESYEEGSKENREFAQQYEYLAAKVSEYADNMRRAKGDIVDHNDARRAAVRLTKEGAEAAARERQMQEQVIAAQQQTIDQTRTLRQEKEKEIEQTNAQLGTQMRLVDAAMTERRQMDDDYRDSLGAIARENREQAQQRAQAAHDEADRMRANAQLAEQTAQQKRTAYEQETQAVNRLDGEVKQLTEDIKAMSAEQSPEPTDKLTEAQNRYNDAVEKRKAAEQALKEVQDRSYMDDPEIKRLDAEIAKIEELIAVSDKYKKQFTKMSDTKFDSGYMGDDSEVRKALHIDSDPRKSIWGAADYLKGAYHDRSRASLADFVKDKYPDEGTAAEYQKSAERVAKGIVQNAQENFRRAIFKEIQDGNWTSEAMEQQLDIFRSQFQNEFRNARPGQLKDDPEYHYYKYVIEQMEKYLEVAKQVEAERAKIAGGEGYLELARSKDDIDQPHKGLLWQKEEREWNQATIKTEDVDQRRKDDERIATEKLTTAKENERIAEENLEKTKQQSATTSDELQRKQTELAAKTDQLAQAKQRQAKAQGEMNTAEQQAAKAQDDANQKQVEAIQLGEKAAQANDEAAKAEESHNAVLQRQDEKIAKLQNDYDALDDTLRKQEGELAAYDQTITKSEQNIAEAERKKAQARELSAKDMRDAIAALRERNDAIGEANPEWENNERLIAQYNQRLEEMKQRSAELRGEVMSLSDALGMAGTIDGGGASVEKMEQAIKTLTEAKRKATDQKDFDEYGAAIDKISQKLKEATSEWMSLADAEKLAEQAGENYYLSEGKSGFVASPEEIQKATQALERQREAVIKNIQQKKANKNATDEEKKALADEEKKLQDLTKKLRDLKFEQDNVNMSQAKMRRLMEQPAQAVSLDELRAAIKRADGELRRMEGSLGKNSKEYKAFAEQVKQAKNTLKDMEGAAKASASAWEKAWSRLKTYVGLYMGFNIMWQKMVGTAGDLLTLSDKMGEVRKTTQMTADQVGRLSDALTKLDTRTSLTGLMEFSSLAGSIGLKTQEDVQGFTEAANMLSVSLPELGSEASRTLMKIADATGDLEKNGNNVRETLERVGSTVIALRANSAAAAGPITDFVSRVGAVGAQAGISIDQIAALGATVDALGGRVEMSATALSRMIPAIRNNSFEVAQAIGMTEKQLKSMSGIDQMVAVFKALRDSVKNFDMTTEEGMNAAADAVENMLGRSASMQEVMKVLNQQGARAGIVFGLLSQNVDTLEEQLKTAGEAYKQNTALMDEYNKMNDTAAAKWERLKNQMEEMFVSDSMQRFLGGIITALRTLVDFISGNVTGAVHALHIAVISLATGFGVLKTGIGAAFVGMGGLATAFTNLRITIGLAIGDMGRYIALKWALVRAHDEEAKAAIRAKLATMGATKAMMANVVLAFVAALGMLAWKLYEAGKAAKEAAAETGRFNQQIADEQKALGELFKPLDKSNTAQEERLRLINEINSKYGKYLGYMLSETSSAIALADAHALIAKRIREEAYEKRIAEKEAKIQDEHSEDVNAAYTKITERVRGSVRGGASAQEIADVLKGIVDNRLGSIKYAYDDSDNIFKARTNYYLDPKIKQAIDGGIERLIVDGKLSRDNVTLIQKAVYKYTVEAHSQHKDIMDQTSNLRSDLRGVQSAIKVDLANNLNTLVSRVASSVSNAVRNIRQQQQPQQNVPLMLQQPQGQGSGLPSLFGGGQQGGTSWQLPWQQQRQTTPEQQMAPKGWKPNIDKKDTEAVRQFVQDQEALRSALNASGEQIDEAQRRVAESWLLTDEQLKEYKKIVEKADRGPGGGGSNPYGSYNDRVDPYEQWDANALVARREEMLKRVRALAGGADVQAVLSEDKRFMDEATRKGIKNMRDAIAWYNEERLKIQEELDARNLTPTGDWKNPEKGGRSKKKPKTPESEGAIAELDRYYSERKELIEEARSKEQMTEAEYNRRLDALEQEHLTKRSELRQTFTSEDKQFIQQFRQWWASVKELDEVSWTAIEAEWIAAWERDRKYNNREAQKDLTAMQAIVVKQLKEIEAIIAKERPFNGITDNLQNNLTKMGLLFKDGVPEDGKFMEENTKRLTFLLKEAENAYSLTFDQLAEDMRKNGLGSWADAIINSENADKEKRALIAQLHEVYDSVQDAIKKEASQVKKQVDIAWNDAILPNGKSMKATYEAAISALGVEQSSVSRANNLIGAGVASERVADKLAIKQLQLQLRMQEHYYNLVRKTGQQRVDDLLREAEEQRKLKNFTAAEKLELDAKHARMSLNLSLAKEETELAKQREEIIARTEESQNRLYTELKEWADLLTSSIQGVFEASHAGDAEYYNERAKLDLTGKGGPGAGTYIVIDNAGTDDARAHYEYLDERQALERQHEIEQQNAQAEAWKKLWDDINMKMSDQITDWLNASLQDAATRDNTDALLANTKAIYDSMGVETPSGEAKPGQPDVIAVQPQPDRTSAPVEPIVISGGSEPVVTQPSTDPENTAATNANTAALNTLTQLISGQPAAGATDMGAAAGGGTTATAEGDVELQKPFFQMTEEETALAMERIQQLWQAYSEGGATALQEMAATLAEMEGIVLPPWQITEEQLAVAMERMSELWQSYAEQGIAAMQQMSDAMAEMPNDIPNPMQVTEEQVETSNENMQTAYQGLMDLSGIATEKVIGDQSKRQKGETETDKKMQASGQSLYAKLTQAANLYGIAYQAMSNDNLSAAQKFEMIALQAAGQAAIAALTANYTKDATSTVTSLPLILAECLKINPIAGSAIFAALTAVIGGLMGVAASKLAKGKAEIAQVTGSSASAGRLATGMLTYAEGNVNEFTDPASLTPGRQYNVDGADGRTYRARYMGKDAKTHITNGPEFHLVGEKGREAIIDAHTTRLMQTDDTGIWQAIQTLYNGGRVSGFSTRRGRGVHAFKDGNLDDFEDISGSGMEGAEGFDDLTAMQDSLDRNTAVQEALLERLNQPIVAQNVWTGPEGIPNMVNKYQKEAKRHGVKYL